MKTKLLKKVRKRYSITHYPEGVYMDKSFYGGPLTILWDEDDSWRMKFIHSPKQEGYEEAYQHMLKWIRSDYGTSKSRYRQKPIEPMWYKK